jgi:hypothetical protein
VWKLFIVLLLFGSSTSQAQVVVNLPKSVLKIYPTGYFLRNVIDERKNTNGIGQMLIKGKLENVSLNQRLSQAFLKLAPETLLADNAGHAIVIKVNNFELKETMLTPAMVEGKFKLKVTVEVYRADSSHFLLTTYQSSFTVQRTPDNTSPYTQRLGLAVEGVFKYLEKWMLLNQKNNFKLAQGVKIRFVKPSANLKEDKDTLFYPQKLKWSDFKGPIRAMGVYSAAVFTSFLYEGGAKMEDGFIVMDIALKTYLVKEGSWAKPIVIGDNYSLNHEQRHFDICEIISRRFQKKLSIELFSIDDFDSQIQYMYLEMYRELHKLQERYDFETSHGQDTKEQQRWAEWIDKELERMPK